MMKTVLSAVIAAVLAGGLGFASIKVFPPPAAKPAETTTPIVKAGPAKAGGHGAPAKPGAGALQNFIELPPVVVGLSAPAGMWVRFEGAAIVEPMDAKTSQELRARLAEDFASYFAAMSLPEIEGAVGLKAVREDLQERARLRSEGKVKEVIISTLVAQ
jgi:flagellar FliL protein